MCKPTQLAQDFVDELPSTGNGGDTEWYTREHVMAGYDAGFNEGESFGRSLHKTPLITLMEAVIGAGNEHDKAAAFIRYIRASG